MQRFGTTRRIRAASVHKESEASDGCIPVPVLISIKRTVSVGCIIEALCVAVERAIAGSRVIGAIYIAEERVRTAGGVLTTSCIE